MENTQNKINDGGPAFPLTRTEYTERRYGTRQLSDPEFKGMSLRDWLAGHATEEDIAPYMPKSTRDCLWAVYKIDTGDSNQIAKSLMIMRCRAKYIYANTMLAARDWE